MPRLLDDVRTPFEKAITPKNILTRIERLEDAEVEPTQLVGDVSEIFYTINNTETGTNVTGTPPTVIGHLATWADITGTLLADGGAAGSGDVVGPAGAVGDNIAVFDGATGKLIKDSGVSLYADGDENLYLAPVFPVDLTTGTKNIAIGSAAGADITDGDSNVAIGINALGTNLNGNNNVALGENALHNGNGSNNIGIGGSAGYYETGSNKFFIDSRNRTNEAGGRTGAIIYGVMDDNSALQELTINGNLTVTGTITPSPGGLSHGQVMARISIGF